MSTIKFAVVLVFWVSAVAIVTALIFGEPDDYFVGCVVGLLCGLRSHPAPWNFEPNGKWWGQTDKT